ncbi:AzlC family ABC transporter permease [Oceanimonas sp. NS1]|nr:AzlC family ABC transporter permease [Oceanimonas sp. NS1]
MTSKRGLVSLTLPVMMGYLPLGAVFGVLWVDAGLTWYWAPLMSVLVYAGAMQYLAVGLLAAGIGWIDLAVATLLVNFRHLFYGLSLYHLLPKGVIGRQYFIFGITDETYSLLSASGRVKTAKLHSGWCCSIRATGCWAPLPAWCWPAACPPVCRGSTLP